MTSELNVLYQFIKKYCVYCKTKTVEIIDKKCDISHFLLRNWLRVFAISV